jgi:DNA polymerase-3 subunit alpha (Gram-positive type)
MATYRLRVKDNHLPFTFMEIDTECHAWYIHADNKEAAVRSLCDLCMQLSGIDEVYVNGDNVTDRLEEERQKMIAAGSPHAEEMDMPEEEEMAAPEQEYVPLPDDEDVPPPTDEDMPDISVIPSMEDIQKAAALDRENPVEAQAPETIKSAAMPSDLPSLRQVLPASAFKPHVSSSHKKHANETGEGMLLGKRHITGKVTKIRDITGEMDNVVIMGTVVSHDSRELRDNRKIYLVNIADDTNGLACKRFFDKAEEAETLESGVKDGMYVKVYGNVRLDKYSGGLVLNLRAMEKAEVETIDHEDGAEKPRVELHLHTKLSLDGLIDLEQVIKTAAKWKHPAISITDHGVIQAFPKIQDLARKYHQKVIYGMEGYLIEKIPENIDTDRQKYLHIIILAQNMTGLRNLYRLVTLSHLKFYRKRPLLPKPILEELHEGLLYGSACVVGEFFQGVLEGKSDEELMKIAEFYDYLEVQPLGNNEFLLHDDRYPQIKTKKDLEDLNRRVIEIGDKMGKPVCATSDAHYLFQEDRINRDILLSTWEKPGKTDSHPPVYLRTTQEMLDEFSYIPKEKAEEIVITNTRRIGESCEVLEPLADESKSYNPKISGADEQLLDMCYSNAKAIYGDPLPKEVSDRLESELKPIIKHGFGVLYFIAHKLVKHSNDRGYLVGSRGSVGSSFVATMAGITEVNPLPPHYVCPNCHWTHFFTDGSVGGGFDLPDKECPKCGHKLNKNGHNIPFAVFLGFDGDKVPDIDLNFSSGDDQANAHKYTEELFGRDNVFRAGTISGIQDKIAFGLVKRYAENRGLNFNDIYVENLSHRVLGVKKTTGQHPAGIMVCPRDMDIHNFTPLQYAANKKYIRDENGNKVPGTITTHFDYHSISGRMLKLDILGHDDPKVIRLLQDMTGVDPLKIPFDDPATISLFSSPKALGLTPEQLHEIVGDKGNTVGALGLPEYGTPFVRQMLEDTKPKNFSELVRISGFSHGTNVWLGNAQDLIKSGKVKLEEAISTRDDVMNYLIQHGVDPLVSFKVMENVRKGRGLEKADKTGKMSNNRAKIEAAHVPQWFIDSCLKISYLFPRAHAVAYVMMAFRIAWFKINYPLAFYASYFTVRAEGAFDPLVILRGLDAQKAELRRIASMDHPTNGDKDKATVIEVAAEMYMRGYTFKPISLTDSDATEFKIVGDQILPPFQCIPALGEQAAKDIVAAREQGPFTSKEDLKKRGKVSQTLIDTMTDMGILKGLPETEELNLFSEFM